MEIFIKNMVCPRCIRVVTEELTRAGFTVRSVALGKAEVEAQPQDISKIAEILRNNGFELLEERTAKLINEIKTFLIQFIREGNLSEQKLKISAILEEKFQRDYNYLSHLFSQSESSTIEKFIIAQKIELIKEWLVYNELTLSQMAWELGYSSVAHLSSQFRQVTGFSPSEFKSLKNHHRKGLEEI